MKKGIKKEIKKGRKEGRKKERKKGRKEGRTEGRKSLWLAGRKVYTQQIMVIIENGYLKKEM